MRDLHDWFLKNRREFPWRKEKTPYRVWISEVMLQQTRASVVVPYFERWMELFPDVASLAAAPLDKVIKAWEGLGYYSRARNLHAAALQIMELFDGEIPSSRAELETIKGFGPYTVGAVLSFGFQKRAPAVDGNVKRVLSRYFLIEGNVCKQPAKRKIEIRAEEILDFNEPWITAEALIELGATICAPKPKCEQCPLLKNCLAFQKNKTEILPIKNIEKDTTELLRSVFVILSDGKVLLKKGEKGRVMADLYEFPYTEKDERGDKLGLDLKFVKKLTEKIHTFTRFKARLFPAVYKTRNPKEVVGYEWISQSKLTELPFSSGHRKILRDFLCEFSI